MGLIDRLWETVQDYLVAIKKQEDHIVELKNNYEREKVALEAKINSATQLKNTLFRNSKVENKISSIDTTIENKLQYFDEQVKLNEEKRDREITIVRERYEAKMNAEIMMIEARADKYHNYIVAQRKMLEVKKDTTIRDLSANIIQSSIGDTFDEDAYPKLTKLKFDISLEEKRFTDMINKKNIATDEYTTALEKDNKEKQREALQRIREEEMVEHRKRQALIEQAKRDREDQNRRDTERQDARRKQLREEEEAKAKAKNWKESVYKKLPDIYRKYYNNCVKEVRDGLQLLDVEMVIEELNKVKPELDNLLAFEEKEKTEGYIKEEVWDKYHSLTQQQKIAIAQMNKPAQIISINKLYVKEESDSE